MFPSKFPSFMWKPQTEYNNHLTPSASRWTRKGSWKEFGRLVFIVDKRSCNHLNHDPLRTLSSDPFSGRTKSDQVIAMESVWSKFNQMSTDQHHHNVNVTMPLHPNHQKRQSHSFPCCSERFLTSLQILSSLVPLIFSIYHGICLISCILSLRGNCGKELPLSVRRDCELANTCA